MARYTKRLNYRKKYPGLSDEMIEVLEKSDPKMEYLKYDLKAERYRINNMKGSVTLVPSREDSYELLTEENQQFAAEGENGHA